jgi:hypothetical protein
VRALRSPGLANLFIIEEAVQRPKARLSRQSGFIIFCSLTLKNRYTKWIKTKMRHSSYNRSQISNLQMRSLSNSRKKTKILRSSSKKRKIKGSNGKKPRRSVRRKWMKSRRRKRILHIWLSPRKQTPRSFKLN